ncbi:MAG TPA: vitamin K epoxide reductase family protein [Streptosporangiaceae bacterium]|nr:vitamin K epoxide reductase family protein [Streptosporangiaceae bacterium]
MAPQKQAKRRRQATSPRKKAPHGGSQSRRPVTLADTVPVPANGAKSRTGQAKTVTNGQRQAAVDADAALAEGDAPVRSGPFGWVRANPLKFTTWLLALFGFGVSIYLTITHYDTHITIACSDNGLVNCQKVTTSSQSMVFGIFPVAVLGLAFYTFMVAINSPLGWRFSQPLVRWARLGSVIVGMGFVLYLIYAEIIEIGNICLWCTSVHVVTFLMFALLVYDATSWGLSSPATPARK